MQITHDVSVAGYMNYMRNVVTVSTTRDIQQNYSAEVALAGDPAALVERMNLLLFYGQMPDTLKHADRRRGRRAAPCRRRSTRSRPRRRRAPRCPSRPTRPTIDAAKLDRVYLAVFLSMASPDYLIQK